MPDRPCNLARVLRTLVLGCAVVCGGSKVEGNPLRALMFNSSNAAHVVVSPGPWAAEVTMEAWVRLEGRKCHTILSRGDGGAGVTDYILQVGYNGGACGSSMNIGFYAGDGWHFSTSEVPTNVWTHVAVTFNGAQKRFYINGRLDLVFNFFGTMRQTASPMYIGRQGQGCACNYFHGQMDEVRVWNVARSGTDISNNVHRILAGTEAGLLAYYRCDDLPATRVTDQTSNHFNGTGVNMDVAASSAPAGPPRVDAVALMEVSGNTAEFRPNVLTWFQSGAQYLEYGLTRAYGSMTETQSFTSVPPPIRLNRLAPNTSYEWRYVLTTPGGVNNQMIAGFRTGMFNRQPQAPVQGGGHGLAWGDYNADGYLDILAVGTNSMLYRNTGAGEFLPTPMELPNVSQRGLGRWADFNNDGWPDMLVGGDGLLRVYRNNSGTNFTELNAGLPAVNGADAVCADFNNDGKSDIVVCGNSDSGLLTAVFRNNGDGTFTQTAAALPGVWLGGVAVGDCDNDGWTDILLTGGLGGTAIAGIYRNNGADGSFTDVEAGLGTVVQGAVAWTDYDNDGWLDALVTGDTAFNSGVTAVYRNNRDRTFNLVRTLPGAQNCVPSAADFDNDGWRDIAAGGYDGQGFSATTVLRLYRNASGSGSFLAVEDRITSVAVRAVEWGDHDLDGRADLLAGYATASALMTAVVTNQNTPPTVPTGLSATLSNEFAVLAWNAATDAQTAAAGLSYNLRVGTYRGGNDVVSGDAHPVNGRRLMPGMGNAQHRRFAILKLPLGRTYYWSVQAIDSGLAASAYAAEGSFVVATAPAVATGEADGITAVTATGHGSVTPNGDDTWAWFEVGTTPSALSQQPEAIYVGTGVTPVPVSGQLSGLAADQQHFYRLVAFNGMGMTSGEIRSFRTLPAPVVRRLTRLPEGGFELEFGGLPETRYTVQASSNLVHWTSVASFSANATSTFYYIEPTVYPVRFFRLRSP